MLFDQILGGLVGAGIVYVWLKAGGFMRKMEAEANDVSDPLNQLRFVKQGRFYTMPPINAEAYRTVFRGLEEHLLNRRGGYRLLAEVCMGSFMKTPKKEPDIERKRMDDQAYRSINSKRVDFLVIDRNGHPVVVLEYQGSGHYQGNARDRDRVKFAALDRVGIETFEVMFGASPYRVVQEVEAVLQRHDALMTPTRFNRN